MEGPLSRRLEGVSLDSFPSTWQMLGPTASSYLAHRYCSAVLVSSISGLGWDENMHMMWLVFWYGGGIHAPCILALVLPKRFGMCLLAPSYVLGSLLDGSGRLHISQRIFLLSTSFLWHKPLRSLRRCFPTTCAGASQQPLDMHTWPSVVVPQAAAPKSWPFSTHVTGALGTWLQGAAPAKRAA